MEQPTTKKGITVELDYEGLPIVHVKLDECREEPGSNGGVNSGFGQIVTRVFIHDGDKLGAVNLRLWRTVHGNLRASVASVNRTSDPEASVAVRPWERS